MDGCNCKSLAGCLLGWLQVWYSNVPYDDLASYKADQNWVKKKSDKLEFPGGGTQFKNGVGQYIEYLERIWPEISWGKHTRVLLDVGCGVASFGGYLFDRNVLAMSFAPKDEHEAQVQMALERGIPAVSAVMGTQRLVYPSNVFDVVHCARCRVPWDADGGLLLLELNRILRPGGLFVWSATPVYQDDEINQKLWKDTIAVTESIAWKMLIRNSDPSTSIGAAIFQKPKDNKLYDSRKEESPPICHDNDNPDAAWYVRMTPCIHRIPTTAHSKWPAEWPMRLNNTPAWLSKSDKGLYGKTAPEDFEADALHWKRVVQKSYLGDLDIDWSTMRNIMDMKADYGGFAAALISQPVWVMNIVPINEPDTLPIIFDRGLIGMYHDWCEPHSTYPRSYDLLHANHLLGSISKTCKLENLLLEMDRILRPDGWAIFRDEVKVLNVVQEIVKSLHWDVKQMNTKKGEEILAVQKRFWRPHAST
jgi:SAM-dependent methyltransferase